MNESSKPYTISTKVQKLFITALILPYIIQFAFTLATSWSQFNDKTGLPLQLAYYAVTYLLPVVLLLVAYKLNPRKLDRVARTFESMLITICAVTFWAIFSYLIPSILFKVGTTFGFDYVYYVTAGATVVITAIVLIILRVKRVWA